MKKLSLSKETHLSIAKRLMSLGRKSHSGTSLYVHTVIFLNQSGQGKCNKV